MQVEVLLLPLGLHGFAYLNAVPEVARHCWRPHEDPVASHGSNSLAFVLSLTCLDMQLQDTAHFVKTRFKTHCCGTILAAPLLTGFGGQQWGQVLVRDVVTAYEMTVLPEVVYIAPVPAVFAASVLAALQHL